MSPKHIEAYARALYHLAQAAQALKEAEDSRLVQLVALCGLVVTKVIRPTTVTPETN